MSSESANQRYRRHREKFGTQQAAARALGVTIKTISQRETTAPFIKEEAFIAIKALSDQALEGNLDQILESAYSLASRVPDGPAKVEIADLIMKIQRALGKTQRDILTTQQRQEMLHE